MLVADAAVAEEEGSAEPAEHVGLADEDVLGGISERRFNGERGGRMTVRAKMDDSVERKDK